MKGLRALGAGVCLAPAFVALFASGASAQGDLKLGPRGNRPPIADQSISPRVTDPQAYDAIDLFSRVCVSTRGDRNQTIAIIGDGDSAIEKMDPGLLRALQNGEGGGIGWIIRMPLGDRTLIDLPAAGGCLVRAPRVNTAQLESAFRNLLEQYSASERFTIRRLGEQTKTVDQPARPAADGHPAQPAEKLKFRILAYQMTMPDSGRVAQLALSSTESRSPIVQATLSFLMEPPDAGSRKP